MTVTPDEREDEEASVQQPSSEPTEAEGPGDPPAIPDDATLPCDVSALAGAVGAQEHGES